MIINNRIPLNGFIITPSEKIKIYKYLSFRFAKILNKGYNN